MAGVCCVLVMCLRRLGCPVCLAGAVGLSGAPVVAEAGRALRRRSPVASVRMSAVLRRRAGARPSLAGARGRLVAPFRVALVSFLVLGAWRGLVGVCSLSLVLGGVGGGGWLGWWGCGWEREGKKERRHRGES